MSKQKALRVIDTSVTEESVVRIHEIFVNGNLETVEFKYGEEKILPFEVGIKFMKDGFIVEEVDGSKLELPVIATDNVQAQLKKGECIARFSELTFEALKLRVAQKKDGEIFLEADEDERPALIDFLNGNVELPKDYIDGKDNLIEDDVEEIDVVAENQAPQVDAQTLNVSEAVDDTTQEDKALETQENAISDESSDKDASFTLEEIKKATDSALVLITANGLDINDITGTGANGNITKPDVEKFLEAKAKA